MNRPLRAACALLCAIGCSASAQVRYDNRIVTVASNVPVGSNANVMAIPNATVTICNDGACGTLTPIFSNSALTVQTANPMLTDGQGRFGFWAAAGSYFYKAVTPSGNVLGIFPFTLGGSSSSTFTSTTEVPAGAVNGSNTAFTVTHTPTLLLLTDNGVLYTPGVDYTLSGMSLSITTVPQTGDKLLAQYFYGATPGTPFQQTPTGTINGSNTAFTLAHAPTILFLSVGGVQLSPGTDYILSGTSLTMTVAPTSGVVFNAQYFY